MPKKTITIEVTHDELIMIGDALNTHANFFDSNVDFFTGVPEHCKAIWGKAAEERRALTKRLIKQKEFAASNR